MKKYILIAIPVLILIIGGTIFFWLNGDKNPNDEAPEIVETPPEVKKINSLALAKRPYVTLIPHENTTRCGGVDLGIESLKNNELNAEYDLEYTTEKKIEGMFGRRDFTETGKDYDPLEFGTCSKGKCVCHDNITGGSIKLSFKADEDYVLKGDFTDQNIGEKAGKLTSLDVRLTLDTGELFEDETNVIIMNTFGLPGEMNDKVILGPYGIYVEGMPKLDSPIKATIQSKEVADGKVQYWDGGTWQLLEKTVDGDKATFDLPGLGVVVLTE